MKKLYHIFALILLAASACSTKNIEKSLTDYVNPHIGSGGHGHVFVGASVPFGMVQLGPTSVSQEWDWCSGYHRSDSTVTGFSHTHLSGTGIGDLFDITVMPVCGETTYSRTGIFSYADRTKEIAQAGYYSVPLTRYGIEAELTATARTGFHRYTFPASDSAAIVIDLENGGCWDKTTMCHMEAVSNKLIAGYRYSKGWARAQKVYFVAEFEKPFDKFELKGENGMYGRASFTTEEKEKILLRVAISPVSIEGAMKALEKEASGIDFETAKELARNAWERELSRIKITTPHDSIKRIFYTAMYHSMIAPMLFSDTDGNYRGADGNIYNSPTPRYTGFSLWDTYRAKQPLMTIIQPQRAGEFIDCMVDICDKQGKLPVWHLWGNETNCMVGDPAIPVVADGITKNIPGFDKEKAFEAIKTTALKEERGKGLRTKYGYIPCNMFNEAIAYDMEYAIADGAASLASKALGKEEEYRFFMEKSRSYRKYFDQSSGFIRGVNDAGMFRTPFNPYYSAHRADDYCEGNAWQYTWLAPHDINGYITCFGSKEAMLEKLDSLFLAPSTIEGDPSPDISGMIGQFAHGNEPSHHILYIYTMLGKPHKSAERVREVLATQYRDDYDGLSGNEDMGQMSAWYIMSALGFYQVEPASGRYWFGSPIIDSATLMVEKGTFTIKTTNNNSENIYIKSIKLNGEPYTLPYITHEDIARGGEIIFEMSNCPAQ